MIITGNKLRYLLSHQCKTARELSAYLGISSIQVSRWINNHKPIPKCHLKKIAQFFNVPIEELNKDINEKYKELYDMITEMTNDERTELMVYILNFMHS